MSTPDVCATTVYGGPWSKGGTCGKPVKEDGMCGVHAGAQKRRAANGARRTAQLAAEKERRAQPAIVADLLREYCGELPGVEWTSGRLTISYDAAVALVAALSVKS